MSAKEKKKLKENNKGDVPSWERWGPFVSERAWGTVREDNSKYGDPWNSFTHDDAVFRSYRWGDDGIAGFCDRYQTLLFAPAFWNGKDSILKERLFGLASLEGNHGEDVKEYYFYLDGTPSHSYMKYLYKYPHEKFPYEQLREENKKRSAHDPEFELIDTGIFDNNHYFDIVIEYAKVSSEDLCIRIEAFNRSDRAAPLHIIPHLWFRNRWAHDPTIEGMPSITAKDQCMIASDEGVSSIPYLPFDYKLGEYFFYFPDGGELLFTENETKSDQKGFYKDAFHRYIIHHEDTVNRDLKGTKAGIHYEIKEIAPRSSEVLYFRLSKNKQTNPLKDLERVFEKSRKEADSFYENIHPKKATDDDKLIQRQALAGLLWSKQIYLYDVDKWLKKERSYKRNIHWQHLNSKRILLMPDKWEYPWFAAWDHAFHCLTMGLIDIECAKEQLWLLLFDQFQHPNGQIPAYEWEFSDLNPPVQAWSALRIYEMEIKQGRKADNEFLEKCFHKLLMNFSWWVNKVDSSGNNVFEGGFLGLDNINAFDRSQPFGSGAVLQQSDGTGWMAMFCLNLMRIALILAQKNPVYESLATKFFQHFIYIADAMKKMGNRDYEMWSEKDGFFYDVLTFPDGTYSKFRVRSLVGLIPLYAVELLDEQELVQYPEFHKNFLWFIKNRSSLTEGCITTDNRNGKKTYLLSLFPKDHLQSVLNYIWDPNEFRSNYGLRSLSKYHEKEPFIYGDSKVTYEPGESQAKVKGGNSNWRGPVWLPTTFLLIDSLKIYSKFYQQDVTVKIGDEKAVTIREIADSFSQRVISIFRVDEEKRRPFSTASIFKDKNWHDHLLFFEHFNPETGEGLGASHQTGWSALVANLIDEIYS